MVTEYILKKLHHVTYYINTIITYYYTVGYCQVLETEW